MVASNVFAVVERMDSLSSRRIAALLTRTSSRPSSHVIQAATPVIDAASDVSRMLPAAVPPIFFAAAAAALSDRLVRITVKSRAASRQPRRWFSRYPLARNRRLESFRFLDRLPATRVRDDAAMIRLGLSSSICR